MHTCFQFLITVWILKVTCMHVGYMFASIKSQYKKIHTDCCLHAEQIVLLDLINQQLQWCIQAPQVAGDHSLNVLQTGILQRSHILQF